jgi:hypothetical protein
MLSCASRLPFFRAFRELKPDEGKRFHFYALWVALKNLLFFGASYRPAQVIDTAVIADCWGEPFVAMPRNFPAAKAYTSYMCNPYAIFTIHCIGKSWHLHFET